MGLSGRLYFELRGPSLFLKLLALFYAGFLTNFFLLRLWCQKNMTEHRDWRVALKFR